MLAQGHSLGWTLLASLPHSMVVLWVLVMVVGAVIFAVMWSARRRAGEDPAEVFLTLPPDPADE